jgi:hypothetical protein
MTMFRSFVTAFVWRCISVEPQLSEVRWTTDVGTEAEWIEMEPFKALAAQLVLFQRIVQVVAPDHFP